MVGGGLGAAGAGQRAEVRVLGSSHTDDPLGRECVQAAHGCVPFTRGVKWREKCRGRSGGRRARGGGLGGVAQRVQEAGDVRLVSAVGLRYGPRRLRARPRRLGVRVLVPHVPAVVRRPCAPAGSGRVPVPAVACRPPRGRGSLGPGATGPLGLVGVDLAALGLVGLAHLAPVLSSARTQGAVCRPGPPGARGDTAGRAHEWVSPRLQS